MKNKFSLVIVPICTVSIMTSCSNAITTHEDSDDSVNITNPQIMNTDEYNMSDNEEGFFDSNSEFVSKIDREAFIKHENCLFKNGLLCVTDENTGKFGYINSNGEIEIGIYLDEANDFMPNGLAAVGINENKKNMGLLINPGIL